MVESDNRYEKREGYIKLDLGKNFRVTFAILGPENFQGYQRFLRRVGRDRRGNPIEKSSKVGKNQNQKRWSKHTQRGDYLWGEICYTMQIWTESPSRVFAGEDRNSEVITHRIQGGLGKDENLLQSQKATNIVGESRVLAEEHGQILKINKGMGWGEPKSKQNPTQKAWARANQ